MYQGTETYEIRNPKSYGYNMFVNTYQTADDVAKKGWLGCTAQEKSLMPQLPADVMYSIGHTHVFNRPIFSGQRPCFEIE